MNAQGSQTQRLKESFPDIFEVDNTSKRNLPHYKSRNSEQSLLGETKNNPEMDLTENIHSQKTANTLTCIKDKLNNEETSEDHLNISLHDNKFPVWNVDSSNFNNYQIFSTFNCNTHELHKTDGAKVNISKLLSNTKEPQIQEAVQHQNSSPNDLSLTSNERLFGNIPAHKVRLINREFSKLKELTPSYAEVFKDFPSKKAKLQGSKAKGHSKGFRKCAINQM